MTSSSSSSVSSCSTFFRRVVLAVTLTLFASPALAVVSGGVADAAPRPRSSAQHVAASAVEALEALSVWERDGDPFSYIDYVATRDVTAALAAEEIGLDADRLAAAWGSTHPTKQVAVLGALTQLGVPYRKMMSSEGVGFDCSGLTTYAWDRAGISLTRSSGDQIRQATKVDRSAADAGDLVYYPGHVMMYLGIDHAVVHSPNTGNHVEITFVSDRRQDTVVYADPLG
jgi:cell wall-associated NlpC family hydrolase